MLHPGSVQAARKVSPVLCVSPCLCISIPSLPLSVSSPVPYFCLPISGCASSPLPGTLKMRVGPRFSERDFAQDWGPTPVDRYRDVRSICGLTEASPFSPFSPFCLSGSPPRPPVMGEHLGARPGFKSHFHPLLTVDLRQVIPLETQFVLLENGAAVTPCPQSCGDKGRGEGIRVESLGSPPTQPSPPGTLKHRDGLGCRTRPCCTEGS